MTTSSPACPWCNEPLSMDAGELPSGHCKRCAASVLPRDSTVKLLGVVGVSLEVFRELLRTAAGKALVCPVCTQEARPLLLRTRQVHVCGACGSMVLGPGVLHGMTSGKHGHPVPQAVKPEVKVHEDAPTITASEAVARTLWLRFVDYWTSSSGKRQLVMLTSLLLAFGGMMLTTRPHKPLKIGKDGLPEGALGMHPESEKVFRDVVGGGALPRREYCPDGAKLASTTHGWRCEKDGVAHGPFEEDRCDLDGEGRVERGSHSQGKKHGRFTVEDCEGGVLAESNYVDDALDGEEVEYRAPGHPRRRTTWKAGKRQGPHYEYHDNGRVAVEGYYQGGEKAARWVHSAPDGRMLKEERF